MCGITAFFAYAEKSHSLQVIQEMNNTIRHRGPDDEGYYVHDIDSYELNLIGNDTPLSLSEKLINISTNSNKKVQLALGHRRLSIVDLSDLGHQPLSIDNENYWICFNGEVYNHIELRDELSAIGYIFKSKSDTEVILTAYKEWGRSCLDKLNGMFAFIIYNKQKHQAFIARDRFGIKPLYYYKDDIGIYFASEIKQFMLIPSWSAKLNHQRAYDFLHYGLTDHASDTMFANVWQLRGGEYLELTLNNLVATKIKPQRWYDLPNSNYTGSYREACNIFKEKFINSIKLRLRSDVDVGSCLSGGLDSSSIVSTMHEELKMRNATNKIKTFSACSHYKEFDEKEYIEVVVKKTNAEPYYTYPELNELFTENDKITWHQDEPFGSTSIFAQWEVFKLAKKHNIKVMLDGQGADEQLCGYKGLYIQTYLNELFKTMQLNRLNKEIKLFNKIHGINKKQAQLQIFSLYLGKLKKPLKRMLLNLPVVMQHKIFGKSINVSENWLNNSILNYSAVNPFLINGIDSTNIKKTSYSQLMTTNLSMLLHWEDRDSMAHSLESRVPFLDYKVVEFIYSLPTKYKISDGILKKVLRDGLDGVLPDEIKNRQTKLGFVTPEEIWVKENANIFREKIIESVNLSRGILNMEMVLKHFDEIVNGVLPFDFWVWRVISFGTWMKTFSVSVR